MDSPFLKKEMSGDLNFCLDRFSGARWNQNLIFISNCSELWTKICTCSEVWLGFLQQIWMKKIWINWKNWKVQPVRLSNYLFGNRNRFHSDAIKFVLKSCFSLFYHRWKNIKYSIVVVLLTAKFDTNRSFLQVAATLFVHLYLL